tara:strand:+ start:160 stop:525 length:366 start_codon:yes stop_codon:yes gene_type:complete
MKITREQLKQLIAETIREERGVLLEMEPMSGAYEHPGDRAGPGAERPQHDGRDRHREETEDLLKILQDLYHLGQKSSQLHDMLCNEDRLEPEVVEKITLASDAIGQLFDSVLYEKTKGNVQ